MTTEVDIETTTAADALPSKTLATIRDDQQTFDDKQIAILRQLGIEDATQADIALFFHYCRTTGLDPFRKQIYMVGRNTKVTEWVGEDGNRRKVERFVTKYTIQTGIDGYRRNGRKAADRLGESIAFDGPYWCGEDGEWKEIWPAKTPPVAAKYTVFRNGEPFSAIVHYDEFVQTNFSGEPNSMWGKMPRNQIGKCAEAMAYRRAFPDDFAGLIMEDAAQPTVIDQQGNVERAPAGGATSAAALRAAAPVTAADILGVTINAEPEPAPEPVAEKPKRTRKPKAEPTPAQDAEVVDESPEGASENRPEPETPQVSDASNPVENRAASGTQATDDLRKSARDQLSKAIFATFNEVGLGLVAHPEDRLIVIEAIVGRKVASSKELTDDELQKLRNSLFDRKRDGVLDDDINNWLNEAALREANAEEQAAAESGSND